MSDEYELLEVGHGAFLAMVEFFEPVTGGLVEGMVHRLPVTQFWVDSTLIIPERTA